MRRRSETIALDLQAALLNRAGRQNRTAALVMRAAVIACAATLIATLCRLAIGLVTSGVPFATYFPALIVATLLGGWTSGALTLLSGAMMGAVLFLPTEPASALTHAELAALFTFLVVGAVTVAMSAYVARIIARARSSERMLLQVLEAAEMATWEDGPALNGPVWGAEFRDLLDLDPDAAATPELLLAKVHETDRQLITEWLRKLRNGEPQDLGLEFRAIARHGQETWFQVRGRYLDRDRRHAIGSIRNITNRKRNQLQLELINSELRHRLKNVFAMASAIAAQTVNEGGTPESITRKINDRIRALAAAQDLLLPAMSGLTRIGDLTAAILRPMAPAGERLLETGPDVLLPRDAVTPLGLVLHELGTNAIKYGAWSQADGTVALTSTLTGDRKNGDLAVAVVWSEMGGPEPGETGSRGFGLQLIENGIPGGRVSHRLSPAGLECRIEIPLVP
jgi:two-component sensor histidine kinase